MIGYFISRLYEVGICEMSRTKNPVSYRLTITDTNCSELGFL